MTARDRIRAAMQSPAGAPIRVAHLTATRAQLAAARAMDARRCPAPSAEERARVAAEVTMAVKTFQRPAVARRLVRSARRVFDGRIVIADDSRSPLPSPDDDVDVLALPFNSGVPHGRNAALDAVDTEFTLVTDDDIVFSRGTTVGRALDYLHAQPEVDIVGFVRIELPRRYFIDHPPTALFRTAAPPLRRHDEVIGGLPVRLKVEQVYLARTASLQRVRWDERIRMVDHNDFFSAACGRLVTVLDHQIVAYHARTPFDPVYTAYRTDTAADLAYLRQKWESGPDDPAGPAAT